MESQYHIDKLFERLFSAVYIETGMFISRSKKIDSSIKKILQIKTVEKFECEMDKLVKKYSKKN